MRRSTLGIHLLSALTLAAAAVPVHAQEPQVATAQAERWSAEELDNLLAPIALYPDPILAQVLIAATYPDQVLAAQAHVRAFGNENIDAMPWEISVKAVARYEPVLNLMAEGEDWMTALGQAYASQANDVMDAVQRLRVMANVQGNLRSTAQQQVVVEREVIRIVPAEPRVIYVPTYDPAVVYHQPIYVTHAHPAYWSWGVGYPVGVWLTYDFDWWGHRIYYHGWHSHGPRWVVFARPWIVINPIYVAPRHTVIVVNRGVAYRRWDTQRVRRYSSIHRHVTYDRHDRGYRRDVGRGYAAERGDNGRRVGPPSENQRGSGGRRVGPESDSKGAVRGSDARASGGARTATATRRGSDGERVVPLPGAPTRIARAGTRENVGGSSERGAGRVNATPRAGGETARSSNGTWNPRPTRETAVPARSPRVDSPAPRGTDNGAPRVTSPRSSSQPSPRVSSPRGGGEREPRASAPRSNGSGGSSAPRASAPRSGGSSAPRASAPRGGGGGEARGSSRGGGSSGGSRGGSEARGGRGRGN